MRWLTLTKAKIISSLRTKEVIFWSVLFPILMLFLMVGIFGNSQSSGSKVTFNFGIVKESSGMWSNIVYKVFDSIKKNQNFKFRDYNSLKSAEHDLKDNNIDCVIKIPKNYDSNFFISPQPLTIEYKQNNASSRIANDIMKSIILSMNIESAKYIGKKVAVPKTKIITLENVKFNMTDYFFAGIMIMAVLSIGSFNVPISLVWEKESGISKRFSVTPLKENEIFLATLVEFLFLVLLQFIFLSLISIYIFKGDMTKIVSLPTMYYTLLTSLISISMGYFIASVSKSLGSANAIGNIIFFPFQFLGGLYFPVLNAPESIKWIVVGNPITYIAAGMRDAMGIMPNPFSLTKTIIIPIIWFLSFTTLGIIISKKAGDKI